MLFSMITPTSARSVRVDVRWTRSPLWLICVALGLAGCHKSEVPTYSSAAKLAELSPPLQDAVKTELVKLTGSYREPKLLSEKDAPAVDLGRGQAVYQERCVQCHGVAGDGNGLAAKYMYPKPRDYRKGLFKFTATPYGARPLRDDLVRTVRQGIRGTSMPGFALLPEHDQQAVVDYVIMLARRGEVEQGLVNLAESEEELEPEMVQDEVIATVLRRWGEADESEVRPLTLQPKFTTDHVVRGKQAFLTKGCSKCHGEDGRGQTKDNRGNDAWGQPTRAADLTSGMLHGGPRPIDLYRRIYSGINGTPMPSFATALQAEPDTIWDLVAYVLSLSSHRRDGQIPPPGPIKPYLATEPAADASQPTE